MTNAQWFLLVGGLLLAKGLTSSFLRRLPITPAIIYLARGLAGRTNDAQSVPLQSTQRVCLSRSAHRRGGADIAVSAGVKMPVPVTFARWRTPIFLASVSMAVSVGLVAAFAHYLLGLSPGAGVLLGAIVAPHRSGVGDRCPDPSPGDRDQLRFTLTCEAGMNDGSAFPFVMLGMGLLGMHELGEFGLRWSLVDVLWATVVGSLSASLPAPHWPAWARSWAARHRDKLRMTSSDLA